MTVFPQNYVDDFLVRILIYRVLNKSLDRSEFMAKLTPEAFFSILRDLGYGGGCSGVLATQEIPSVAPLELVLIN